MANPFTEMRMGFDKAIDETMNKLQKSLDLLIEENTNLANSNVEACKKGDYENVSKNLTTINKNANEMNRIMKEQNDLFDAAVPAPKRTFLSYYPGIAFLFGSK